MLMLLIPRAAALCLDGDSDGWVYGPPLACPGQPAGDCDDSDGFINPSVEEDGFDLTDDNCDGSPAIRRDYVASGDSLADFTSANVSIFGNHFRLSASGSAYLTLTDDLSFRTGVFTVGIDVDRLDSGATCWLRVDSAAMSAAVNTYLVLGTQQIAVPEVEPWDTVTEVSVICTGSGWADIDWLTIQDGDYAWAPARDVNLSFTTMGLPGGGRHTFTRLSEGYDGEGGILLAGSDVGGFAWAPAHSPSDTSEWIMANGLPDDPDDTSGYATADAIALWRGDEDDDEVLHEADEYDVYLLTARSDGNGTLLYSPDLTTPGQSWAVMDDTVGGWKHRDKCDGSDDDSNAKSLSSGKQLVPFDAGAQWLAIASAEPGNQGVRLYDTLYGGPSLDVFDGLPDASPSALWAFRLDDDSRWLLVGYRVLVDLGSSLPEDALYLCPADFDPDALPSPLPLCEPVYDSDVVIEDVRDIELARDADAPGQVGAVFLVSDGGRAWDRTAAECLLGDEATVYAVRISAGMSFPSFSLWDTDEAPLPNTEGPSWSYDGSAVKEYWGNGNACVFGSGSTYGELVAPTSNPVSEAHPVSTVAVDPTGAWAFAFYAQREDVREYGCVRVFRAPLDDLEEDMNLAWEPFQEFRHGDVNYYNDPVTAGAHVRKAHVDARNAFMRDEPRLEAWAPGATHDAVFVPNAAGGSDLLAGGNFHWWAHQDPDGASTAEAGWDSDNATHDLDIADWSLAFGGAGSLNLGVGAFQDMSSMNAAVCPLCWYEEEGQDPHFWRDVLIGGGEGDYTMSLMYGQTAFDAPPAYRPCEMDTSNAAGVVAVYSDPTGTNPAEAWMIGRPQGGGSAEEESNSYFDPVLIRAVLYSNESLNGGAPLGEEWCWDAAGSVVSDPDIAPAFATGQHLYQADPEGWGLTCRDSEMAANQWFPCDTSDEDDPYNLLDAGVGHILDIVPVGPGLAVLVTASGCLTKGCTAGESETGLWLVAYDAVTGLAYEHIDFADDATIDDDCDEAAIFQYDEFYNSRPNLAVHPATNTDQGYVRLLLSSRHADCGLLQVEFALGAEDAADWTGIAWDPGECDLTDTTIQGVTPAPDGRSALVWGGNTGICSVELSGPDPTYWPTEKVVAAADIQGSIWTLEPHPHVADTYYFGLFIENTRAGCPSCDETGVYTLERRTVPSTGASEWDVYVVSGAELEHRRVVDLDFGPGSSGLAGPEPIRHVYTTTNGGGHWDGSVSW